MIPINTVALVRTINGNIYDHAYKLYDGIKHMLIKDITARFSRRVRSARKHRQRIKAVAKVSFSLCDNSQLYYTRLDKVQYLDLSNVKAGNKNSSKHFSSDEVETVWKYIKKDNANEYASVALMLIYTRGNY